MTIGAVPRSETEAFNAYSGAIRRAIACFADNVAFRRGPAIDPEFGGRGFTHGGVPFRLQDRHGTPIVALAIRLHYAAVQASYAPPLWEVRTVRYVYEVHRISSPPHEMAGYHWHPSVPEMTYAHCHAYAAPPDTARLHLPTCFATIGSILRWLMRDFRVSPLATNWIAALDEADTALEASLRRAAAQERPRP